ncbi:hypothetical protein NDU88_000408 [Pleurodeles waltl]|uniref:Uncharacterized protein n=1 Tax=Pleurodeles waltl TaxID=8319 RepID=A0AAV7TEX6_PLEWA|nr:hypothetical protein NDU88_000408 [Pleurodeles waltl]
MALQRLPGARCFRFDASSKMGPPARQEMGAFRSDGLRRDCASGQIGLLKLTHEVSALRRIWAFWNLIQRTNPQSASVPAGRQV